MLLRARIEEIPAVLRWNHNDTPAGAAPVRRSSMRIASYVTTLLVSGFLYRPILFFLAPALISLLAFAACALAAIVQAFEKGGLAAAWSAAPHLFVIGGICLLIAVQLLACGLISIQNKCYFEQMFHLGTTTFRSSRAGRN
jgi:uncharacterized membrane protein